MIRDEDDQDFVSNKVQNILLDVPTTGRQCNFPLYAHRMPTTTHNATQHNMPHHTTLHFMSAQHRKREHSTMQHKCATTHHNRTRHKLLYWKVSNTHVPFFPFRQGARLQGVHCTFECEYVRACAFMPSLMRKTVSSKGDHDSSGLFRSIARIVQMHFPPQSCGYHKIVSPQRVSSRSLFCINPQEHSMFHACRCISSCMIFASYQSACNSVPPDKSHGHLLHFAVCFCLLDNSQLSTA